ncbi:MAG: 50S ribosomal protein L24 [Nanoarchaeota archaeon]|nr:50S ribosomal protein L24 [Nanoarchaeota archaeon]
MKNAFSKSWNRSVQPRKQRKYGYNAPLHLFRKMNLKSPLSKELKEKYGKRNIIIRTGDKVKISRGQFKGKKGKVNKVISKDGKVYVEGIENIKMDGTKTFYPLKASKLMIIELNTEDKKRKLQKINKKELKNG